MWGPVGWMVLGGLVVLAIVMVVVVSFCLSVWHNS